MEKKGFRIAGPVVNIPAALVANALAVFTLPTVLNPPNQTTATAKSLILRKIRWRNNAAGVSVLSIGTGVGAAFANLVPPIHTINSTDDGWTEAELPAAESFATVTAWVDALVAGGSVDCQIEADVVG